jgi:HAD superfamily 5'-nucleotidase-like hydrolase
MQRLNGLIEHASSWATQVRPSSVKRQHARYGEAELASGKQRPPLGLLDRVYANSVVDMAQIDAIGFDFDHTMVSYKKQLNRRIYQLALERLIEMGYPSEMASVCTGFDPHAVIRGLAVDRQTGALVKLTYSSRVVKARRGHTWLEEHEIATLFGVGGALSPTTRDVRLAPLNDLYALATGCLIGDCIEFHERTHVSAAGESDFREYEPRCIVADVMEAIGHVHTSFSIHREVLDSLPTTDLVEPAPGLRDVLLELRAASKHLFIVTNSPLWYLDPQLKQFVGEDWRELFDVTVVSARKPTWFGKMDALETQPLRLVHEDGSLGRSRVLELDKGMALCGGTVDELMQLTGWTGGRVLYLGDHLYADLVDARYGEHSWITGAVIAEVRSEMLRANSAEFRQTVFKNYVLDTAQRLLQEAMPMHRTPDSADLACVAAVDQQRRLGLDEQSAYMNPSWGSVFHADNSNDGTRDPSLFGFALRRHADLYMSELQNIAHYAVRSHRFVPPKFTLPHEIMPVNDSVADHLFPPPSGGDRAGDQRS